MRKRSFRQLLLSELKFRHKLLATFLMLLFTLPVVKTQATHIVGGEFVFTYMGGNDYQITLNQFFDDVNGNQGAIDPVVDVTFFSKATNARKDSFFLPLISDSYVPYTSIDCTRDSLSTRLLVYELIVTLDPQQYQHAKGYYMVWQRCCRNGTITNIVDPGATGQTFYLEFPPLLVAGQRFINSSPALFAPLSDYACGRDPFQFDFSATDPDGDSLVYSMISPLAGATTSVPNPVNSPAPYDSVLWESGFDINNQIQGTPSLNIDRSTGLLRVNATQTGLFVFGIRCREFRNGKQIGEVRRDFQLLVLTCPTNSKPRVLVYGPGQSTLYQESDTLVVLPGTGNCLKIAALDNDPFEHLRYEVIAVNFQGALPTLNITDGIINNNQPGNDSLIAQLCFPRCSSVLNKIYLIDLVVIDDGCSQPKQDTIRISYRVDGTQNEPPALITDIADSTNAVYTQANQPVSFHLLPSDPEQLELNVTLHPADMSKAAAAHISIPSVTVPNGQPVAVTWAPDCNTLEADSLISLRYIVKDKLECGYRRSDTLSVTFHLAANPAPLPFLPGNIFSPNNDGVNDYFELPKGVVTPCNNKFASIKIFNQWGNRIYMSTDASFKWDGKNTPDGLYYYIVELNAQFYKGWVEIVR